jgi:hypothetical protein
MRAPVTLAPLGSVTVPAIPPVTMDWAKTACASIANNASRDTTPVLRKDISTPEVCCCEDALEYARGRPKAGLGGFIRIRRSFAGSYTEYRNSASDSRRFGEGE